MFVNKHCIGKNFSISWFYMKLTDRHHLADFTWGYGVSNSLPCKFDLRRLEQGIGTVGKEVSDITDHLQTLHRSSIEEQKVGPCGSALQGVHVGGHFNIDGAIVGGCEEPVDSCRNKVGADASSETEGVHVLPFEGFITNECKPPRILQTRMVKTRA